MYKLSQTCMQTQKWLIMVKLKHIFCEGFWASEYYTIDWQISGDRNYLKEEISMTLFVLILGKVSSTKHNKNGQTSKNTPLKYIIFCNTRKFVCMHTKTENCK